MLSELCPFYKHLSKVKIINNSEKNATAECRHAHVWEWPCKCVWRECVKAKVYVRAMTKSHVPSPVLPFFDAVTRVFQQFFFFFFFFFTELFLLNTNAILVAVLYIQSYPQKYTLV